MSWYLVATLVVHGIFFNDTYVTRIQTTSLVECQTAITQGEWKFSNDKDLTIECKYMK